MPNPNLRFDIDALFAHLRESLEHEPDDELEWHFNFRDDDLGKLTRVGESLADEFEVYLQEELETIGEEGSDSGPPLLSVVIQDALEPAEVKQLAARFAALAEQEGMVYDGVTTYEPFDAEEAFAWLDLESATWRLRSFTEAGVVEGEPIPFVFAVEAETEQSASAAAAALRVAGFTELDLVDDEDGLGIIVFAEGRNDEALLTSVYNQVEATARGAGAALVGVQFFEPDEDDDDDQDDDEAAAAGDDD